jgi:hypothetical protein
MVRPLASIMAAAAGTDRLQHPDSLEEDAAAQ